MIDIVVNGQLVAVVVEDLAKAFVKVLVDILPLESNIATYVHREDYQESSVPVNLSATPETNTQEVTE